MGLRRADVERVAVAVNIVSAAVWSLGKLVYRSCSWPEPRCWFPVLSGSAGRKQVSAPNASGREASDCRQRDTLIRLRGLFLPSACKPNCGPRPESKPLPSRMLFRSPEILRDRLTRARTGTQSQSTSGNLG